MKIRIREGNDFDVVWAITRAGQPEDLSSATSMKLTLVVYGLVIEHSLFTVTDNMLSINIPKEVATINGDYRLVFEYTLPDAGQPDEDLKCKTDVVAFRIVPFTAQTDDIYTIDVASDVAIGFKGDKGDGGDDAYQIWLDLGNVGTYEDFIAYLRQPAVDAGASISELEGEIQVSEGFRVSAETARANAEGDETKGRVKAENERVTAEGERAQAFAQMMGEVDDKIEEMETTLSTYDGRVTQVESDITQLAGDVEQLAYVKIKNEAVNGNFENGLIEPFNRVDGVVGESTLAINSSTPISGNYDIRLTITTPATGASRPLFRGLNRAANIGEKIYLHFYAKILSGTPTINEIHDGTTTSTIYSGAVVNGRNTRIIDVAGTSANLGIIYFNSMSAVWDMQMDNLMRINLTETFGAGNEPTEEEMNLLISTLGIDYFEGEITIPAQKVMQWQLKMIRQNRNAIIALGGTII